jgi:hypothetical protein
MGRADPAHGRRGVRPCGGGVPISCSQTAKRADTEAILAVLAEKRVEVMSIDSAGCFIYDWQDIGDQIRNLISSDPRFEEIRRNRTTRRRPQESVLGTRRTE